jgi:hypothetical protein
MQQLADFVPCIFRGIVVFRVKPFFCPPAQLIQLLFLHIHHPPEDFPGLSAI